jgi:acyl-CoA synthetase (AMP-forming)/AMP-acid ligase II
MPPSSRRFPQLALTPPFVIALAALLGPAGASAAALDPPAGEVELSFQLAAEGVQRYVCTRKEGTPATFEWVLEEPVAKLFDSAHKEVGSHSAGPSWTVNDGSKVVKKRLVATADSPAPGAIPWLLLEVDPSGTGMLGKVRWVKRKDTAGGKAPAPSPGACDAAHAGATLDVPYTANYVFYVGKPAAKP